MPWWGWIVVGAALLGAETLVDTQFYLVFFGIAALATGLLAAVGVVGPVWMQWALFGALCIAGTLAFRRRLYARIRETYGEVSQGTVGELAVARDAIAPGGRGRVELRGSVWEARNTGAAPIAPGDAARVERVEGLVLELRREG
jgi:membrane protein implicated in regulation of membrane protease activity